MTDIKMPFGSMVSFMVKWTIASIPAMLIIVAIVAIIVAAFGALCGGLFGMG